MRSKIAFLTLALLFLLQAVLPSDALAKRRDRWEMLGTRTVTDRVDHDTIAAGRQGTFRALKIRVEGRAVQFRDVKIHFANGDKQDVALRNVIPAGGESRVIDIEGRDRAVRNIDVWYDTQSLAGRRAVVKVYGLN